MYSYAEQRDALFTDDGQRLFLSIRDQCHRLLRQAGAARMQEVIKGHAGDSWLMLACVDRLVELGEIREIFQPHTVAGQHRVFIASGSDR